MKKNFSKFMILAAGITTAIPFNVLASNIAANQNSVVNEMYGATGGNTVGELDPNEYITEETNEIKPGHLYLLTDGTVFFNPEIISMNIINKKPSGDKNIFEKGDPAEATIRVKTIPGLKEGMQMRVMPLFHVEDIENKNQLSPLISTAKGRSEIKNAEGKIIAYNYGQFIIFTKEIERYAEGYLDVKYDGTIQGVYAIDEASSKTTKNIEIIPWTLIYNKDKIQTIEYKANSLGYFGVISTLDLYKDNGKLKSDLSAGFPVGMFSKGPGKYVLKIELPEGIKFNKTQEYLERRSLAIENFLVGTNRKFYCAEGKKLDFDQKDFRIIDDTHAEVIMNIDNLNIVDSTIQNIALSITDENLLDKNNSKLTSPIKLSLYKDNQLIEKEFECYDFPKPNAPGFFEGTFKSDAEQFLVDYEISSKELTVKKNEKVNLFNGVVNAPPTNIAYRKIIKDVDTSTVGRKTGRVGFKFDDKSSIEVDVIVNVIEDKESDLFTPQVKENIEITKGTTPTDKDSEEWIENLPNGASTKIIKQPDTSKVGKTEAEVKIIFKDGSSMDVKVPINIIEEQGLVFDAKTETIIVEKNGEITKQDVLNHFLNKPSDASAEVVFIPETNKIGDFAAKINVVFADNSKAIVLVPVKVTGNLIDDFIIYTNTVIKQKGEILKNEEIVQAVINRQANTKINILSTLPSTNTIGEYFVDIEMVFNEGTSKEQKVSGKVKVKVIENIDALNDKIKELEEKLKKCQEEGQCVNPDIDETVVKLKDELAETKKELEDTKQDLENEKTKNKELNDKIKTLEEKIKDLEKQIEDLKKQLADEKDKNNKLQEQIKDLEEKVKDKEKLEEKVKELEKEKDDLVDDLNEKKKENEDLQNKIDEKDREIKDLENQIKDKEKEIIEKQTEIEKIIREKEKLQDKINELEEKLREEKNKNEINIERIRELESKLRDCKKLHLEKDKIIKELRERVIELTSQINDLNNKVNSLTREKNNLEDRYDRVSKLLEDAKARILELEKELLDKKYDEKDKEELLKEIEKLKRQLKDKEDQINEIYKDNNDRRKDLEYDRDNRFRYNFDLTRRDRELRRSDAGYITNPPVYGSYDNQGIAGMLTAPFGSFESNVDEYIRNAIQNPVGTVINQKTLSSDGVYSMLNYIFRINSDIYTQLTNISVIDIKMDTKPFIKNGRTMLPLRYVGYALGAEVGWDDATKTATFSKDGLSAKLTIGSKLIRLSDGRTIKMDSVPTMRNRRMFVPLRYVYNVYNQTQDSIIWDKQSQSVTIKIK